ncbi:class I SAM-dependent methyltransferase [Aeoliella sp. SH292]|uniref:class I SAM-dependent methyltransferase n=1 Tax=Aeoliella sp. SH292 TaxID=3454464 RepID=UPI003F96DB91
MIPAVANIPDQPLADALALVRKVFDANEITARRIESTNVVEYYRQSERAYRMFHSGEGALHIGLSTADTPDGDVGHRRHVELFAEVIEDVDAENVVEFGSGMGYNVRTLAKEMPQRRFTGVDLSPHHTATARREARGMANIEFVEANYQQLDIPSGSCDALLAIETLCQCGDQRAAVAEAYRLLRPGGQMLVIDCFRKQSLDLVTPELCEAALLVEKTAAVDAFAELEVWKQMATEVGFRVARCVDRSAETSRDLARLYRLARRFFKMSLAVQLIRRAMPKLAIENAVCGLLMPYTVGYEAHGYYTITLEKPR